MLEINPYLMDGVDPVEDAEVFDPEDFVVLLIEEEFFTAAANSCKFPDIVETRTHN